MFNSYRIFNELTSSLTFQAFFHQEIFRHIAYITFELKLFFAFKGRAVKTFSFMLWSGQVVMCGGK